MRTVIATLAFLILTSAITACNTMAGAGEDIQSGGQKLERSADDNK